MTSARGDTKNRVRFDWNTWSTGPVMGSIIVGAWGCTTALVACALHWTGAPGSATFLATVTKGLLTTSAAMLVLAMAAGLALERSSVGRARPPKVERTQSASMRVPAGITGNERAARERRTRHLR